MRLDAREGEAHSVVRDDRCPGYCAPDQSTGAHLGVDFQNSRGNRPEGPVGRYCLVCFSVDGSP